MYDSIDEVKDACQDHSKWEVVVSANCDGKSACSNVFDVLGSTSPVFFSQIV